MSTPTSHDDPDTITPEKAQLIALGFAEVRDRMNRQIAEVFDVEIIDVTEDDC